MDARDKQNLTSLNVTTQWIFANRSSQVAASERSGMNSSLRAVLIPAVTARSCWQGFFTNLLP
jgi:hypothetical protein